MREDLYVVLQLVAAILFFAWAWGRFLNWIDWKITERRIWRNVRRKIQ